MAASFPEAKKTFTDIVDGVHDMEGININTAYDEIEAVQTFIGPTGSPQSHNAAMLTMLVGNYVGGRIYKKDGNEIYVGAFRGLIPNAAESELNLRVKTSVTTLSASDLDTGSMAVGFYDIYATADAASTEPTFVFCLRGATPTGYTNYLKIGWFYNETINVLDVTNDFMGNYMDGSGNPNSVEAEGTDDISIVAAGAYAVIGVGTEPMQCYFISNGRDVEIELNATFDSGGEYEVALMIETNGGAESTLKEWKVLDSGGGNIDTPGNFKTKCRNLTAGYHKITAQWKGSADQVGTSYKRELMVKEL